jgi:isopentenyl phosphate kinase
MEFMLWDMLTEDYRFGGFLPKWKPEANRVRRTMLEALASQLRLSHLDAQYSALHGLGHIGHPRARKILQEYSRKPRLRSTHRRYAEEALKGETL